MIKEELKKVQRLYSHQFGMTDLGLEITDPNNKRSGIEPLLKAYKEIIHDEYFKLALRKAKKPFPAN